MAWVVLAVAGLGVSGAWFSRLAGVEALRARAADGNLAGVLALQYREC